MIPEACINQFLSQAHRLGIEVRWVTKSTNSLDASYQASPGKPGIITLHDREARSPKQICILLGHEMVHVLQHWEGEMKAVPPLGWPRNGAPSNRKLSLQEQEAYTAQNQPKKILKALTQLKPVNPRGFP